MGTQTMKVSSTIIRNFEVAKAARDLSDAPTPGKRMGAALFSGARLLSIGTNRYTKSHTNSNLKTYRLNTHAEVSALIKRRHHVDQNLVMYVYRETGDGKTAISKPCKNCHYLLKEAGVRRVWFFNDFGEITHMKL